MKILFVHDRCGYFGGVEQNVADAAAALRARGHACFLAHGQRPSRDAGAYRALFEGVFDWSGPGTNGHAPGSPYLDSIVKRVAPDVIYLHKLPEIPREIASLGPRTVAMVHDHDTACPRRHKYFARSGKVCRLPVGWRCWADLAFVKRGEILPLHLDVQAISRVRRDLRRLACVDAVLVGSRFMRDELLRNGIGEDILHLLPPVPPGSPAAPTDTPGEPRILYVGQLVRGKGVDLLLRALAWLPVPFQATIVGDGNAARALRELSGRLGLNGRVEFAGWVPHDELDGHYDTAKVVVVPSRWPEPFGMVGIEAMRRGRPVVGFDVGGIPDWLRSGETGLLVPEQDIPALSAALGRILGDTELARSLGRAGFERARSVFSHERHVDQLEILLAGSRLRLGSSSERLEVAP